MNLAGMTVILWLVSLPLMYAQLKIAERRAKNSERMREWLETHRSPLPRRQGGRRRTARACADAARHASIEHPAAPSPQAPLPVTVPSAVSVATVVVANLIPAFGVFFLDWNVLELLALFWLETLAIVLLNIPKTLMARGSSREDELACDVDDLIPGTEINAYLYISDLFMGAYGAVIMGLYLGAREGERIATPLLSQDAALAMGWSTAKQLAIAFLGCLATETFAFFQQYLKQREYLQVSARKQMGLPVARFVGIHLFIVVGVGLAGVVASIKPVAAIALAVKTFLELRALRQPRTDTTVASEGAARDMSGSESKHE